MKEIEGKKDVNVYIQTNRESLVDRVSKDCYRRKVSIGNGLWGVIYLKLSVRKIRFYNLI